MWGTIRYYMLNVAVAPREGRVSKKFYIWFPLSPLMYVLSRFIAGLRENDWINLKSVIISMYIGCFDGIWMHFII